ncbi:DUF2288 domain-containing protein [Thiohalomonas denitrificans]|uniref:DUF2288 domain-containing protein n=1 Tax=Thiohalomonas denitrificans TaxID=415747 RepID=A0A1G5QQZ1_9GAMM|nr:DUF2288 domain-containing protein [Thiohalomonas denitrificans]SCZ64253.1 hypothetical protein SAMN03097708_02594 [Thiohalomonas denitrificans]
MESAESLDETRARLNAETARIGWAELERHFARGVMIRVDADLDLVEVAARMVRDDKVVLEEWLASGRVAHPSGAEAAGWYERSAEFWAVVTAPWVLVQEIPPSED